MAKQGVVPDALTQPFWDAANEGRLVIQHCHACNRLQHPPAPTCQQCGSGDHLAWQEMSGRGTIYNYGPGNNPEDGFTCYPTLFGYGPPCRWGDYSTAQVMSDGTVWLGAEFIPPDSYRDFYTNWGTRIAHVNP